MTNKNKIIVTSTPFGLNYFYDEWLKYEVIIKRKERNEKIKKLINKSDEHKCK